MKTRQSNQLLCEEKLKETRERSKEWGKKEKLLKNSRIKKTIIGISQKRSSFFLFIIDIVKN